MTRMVSENAIWDILNEAKKSVSGVRGDTEYGENTLTVVRRVLGALQAALLLHQMKLTSDGKQDQRAVIPLTVYLPRDSMSSLRRFALENQPDKDIAEVVSFILGAYLAQTGYFDPFAAPSDDE